MPYKHLILSPPSPPALNLSLHQGLKGPDNPDNFSLNLAWAILFHLYCEPSKK